MSETERCFYGIREVEERVRGGGSLPSVLRREEGGVIVCSKKFKR